MDTQNVFDAIYDLIKKDLPLYQMLASHSVYDVFWEKFKEMCVQNAIDAYSKRLDISPLSLDIYVDYVFSGVISIYRRYLKKDHAYELEEVSKILNDVTFHGLNPILYPKQEKINSITSVETFHLFLRSKYFTLDSYTHCRKNI